MADDLNYGAAHIRRLKLALRSDVPANVEQAVHDVIRFLDLRLTDAAKGGCHHCDETADHAGAPCRWCGLKTTQRMPWRKPWVKG